jgi:beta-glucosidase
LFVDYRHFDAANIAPRFEFGFGLSYTEFQYSDLSITPVEDFCGQDEELEANWLAGKPSPQGVGSSTALWLHRPAFTVSFTVQNTGHVAGTEVRIFSPSLSLLIERHIVRAKTKQIPQVYLHFPVGAGEPPSVLRGFTDVELQPGEWKVVNVTLSRYDLSVWDVVNQSWMRASGTYSLSVGASSRDFRLKSTLPF